jgi:hypothetical protein
MLGLELTRD